jgi:hypothetical protein
MRYFLSTLSTAVALSVFSPSPVLGQAGPTNPNAPLTQPGGLSNLSIPPLGSNYIELSQVRDTRTQFYDTFQVILVNNGPALPGITATVTSLAPSVQLVPGQSTVHFAPVPANGNVMSKDSFTILIDTSVPFDFSSLSWSFSNPVANPGPNQTATIGSTVTLNGSGSTNPSGIGSLTYSWSLTGVPTGSAAVLTNPNNVVATFVVDVAGTYTAKLTVSNGTTTDSATATISTVSTPPVANAGPNQSVNLGSTVQLDGSKSTDSDGNPLTYAWTLISIPATSAAVLSNNRSVKPTFIADVPGSYIVQLVVNDGNSNSQPSTVMVTTANTAPVANAGPNQRVEVGALVQLNGSGSTDVNGNPLTYLWSLNTTGAPGSKATLSNPNIVNPTFTLDVPGIYVAQLIVNDGFLDSLASTVTITSTTVQPPIPSAGNNQTVVVGSTVMLNGTGSSDPQGLQISFIWSLITKPANSNAVLSAPTVPEPTFVADQPGTYVAQLTVYDGILYSPTPATVTITSTHSAPVANAGPNQTVLMGATVTLNGSQSSDPQNEPITYAWSFLSKPISSVATLTGPQTQNPTFVADAAGTYVVQLIVSDPFASSNPTTVTITAGAMTISLSPNPLNLVNSPVPLTITLSPGAGANPVTVGLSGFDPTVISIPSPTVTVPANSSGVNVTVTPLAAGSTQIFANAGGYEPGSDLVNVSAATITVALNGNATAVGLTRTLSGTVTLSSPAPQAGLTVALSGDPSATGQVSFSPSNVSILPGAMTGTFNVTGVALGSTTITASASGYTSGADSILVVQLGGIAVTQGVTVAPGQSTVLGVQLSTPAPVGGVTVTLVSSDTNILTVSPTVFIAGPTGGGQGSTTPATPAQVTGVAIGSATITASAGGYSGDTETVKVLATLSFSPLTLAVGPGSTQTLNINLSSPAPAGGLPVTLTSSNPAAATVPQSVTITGQSGSVQVTGVAPGQTTVTANTTNPLFTVVGTGVVVTVTTSPVLTCPAVSSGEVGVALNSPAPAVSGGTAPYTFSVVGTLPNGLTLNTSTGAISGTPTASGTFTLQVKDSNGVAAATLCPFTIVSAVVLTCPAVSSGVVGVALTTPAPAVSGGTAPYTFSVTGTLPSGLTLNTSTGAISGTPTAPGTFTLQVKDANGVTAATTCPFTISSAVVLTCPAVSSGEVGVALNSPAPAVSGGTAPYTFSVAGTLPNGLTLNTSTGAISGTPTASGTFTLQVKDSNGLASATTCPFTIAAAVALTCPAVSSGEVGVALNSPAPAVSGGLAPYTFSVTGTLPNGLTLNTSTGAISGTPTASGSFTLQVKDANGASAATTCPFTIAGAVVLTCPAVSSGEVGVALNSPAPAVSGGTAPYTFSVVGTLPNGLTLNTSTGAIGGTPTASGTFTLQVKDANGVTAATTCPFTIASAVVLTCPAVSSGEVGVALNSPAPAVSGGLAPYTFSVTGTLPNGLTLNTSTGAISGTPTASGTFTLQVKDANGVAAVTTCPFTISPALVLTCPAINSGAVGIALNSPAPAVSGGLAPYTFSVTGTLPNGLTLNTSTGAISGTPTASGGFTLQVKDANGVTAATTCPFTIGTVPVLTCPAINSGEVGVPLNSPAASVTGGTAPYTFSVTGTLPGGLTLNTSTGAISGTPTASGTFTLQVKDANGASAVTTCPFTIASAVVLTCPAVSSGEVGVALNSPAPTVSGGTAPYTFSVTGTLPNGLTLNTSTGAISGTPTASGTFTLQVKDADGVTAATTCPFTIAAVLALTCPAVSSGEVGVALNSPAPAVSGGIAPYTFSVTGTLPNGLTLNTSTGAITGTPTASGTFTLQVKDAHSVTATTTCPFTISSVLALTCPAVSSGAVGVALNSPAPAVSGGLAPYTFSVTGTLPGGLTLNTTTGAITGTPNASGTFTLQVKDANGVTATTTCPFTIGAMPVLTCPAISSGEVGVPLNSPAPTVSGGTAPYTFSVTGTLPIGLTLNTSTGAITGTPTASGTFTLQVKDANGASAVTTCPFTIATAVALTCPAVSSGEVGVALSSPAATVSGGTAPYTFSVTGTLPNGLTLNTSTGALTGTPTVSGTFTLQVKDANGATAATSCPFTIASVLALTCPAVSSGEVGVALNSLAPSVSGGIAPYTFSVTGTLPSGLTLNTSTGAITGTPTASGTFTLQVKDANGVTAATTCPFTIVPDVALTCPAVSSGEVGVALNSPAPSVSGGSAPYTFSVTGTLPNGLTLNTSTGAITGTPTASGTFTLQVKDAHGASAATSCPFTIASAPTLTCPAVSSGEVGVALNSPAPVVSGGTAPYTFSLTGTVPNGLTLNASSGAIIGTPTAPGTFTLQVKDANGVVATTTCPFTIVTGPSLTCPANSSFTIGSAVNSPAMAVSGGISPYTFSVVGTLPTGLTVSTATGAITGTPTANGTFTVQVKDANGVVSATTCPFTVGSNALTITTTALPAGTPGVAYSYQPQTSGGKQPFTWTISGLPRGFSGNSSTGLITGTPSISGTYQVTISVTDSSSTPQTASTPQLPLVIATTPLTFTTPATLPSAPIGMPYSVQITASGGQTPYNWSANTTAPTFPTWLTFDLSGQGACGTPVTFCGTPPALGNFSFQVTLLDSANNTITQTFTGTVTPLTGLGVMTVSSATVGQGLQVPIALTFTTIPTTGATMCPDGAGDPGCVTFTSNNPNLILFQGQGSVASLTAPVPANTQSFSVYVQAVSTAPAGTTATITASFPGYANATATITYANSGFVLAGPNGIGAAFNTFQGVQSSLTVYAARLDSTGLFVEPEEVIGSNTLSVPIASSSPTVGAVSPTLLSFSGGTSTATANFTASGVNTGSTSVMLTQPAGFTTPVVGGTLNANVQQSGLVAPSGLVLGKNLQMSTNVSLNGNAPSSVLVTLQSLDSNNLLFACPAGSIDCSPSTGASSTSITVEIPQNSSQSASFFMQALGSTGSIGYTISAPNYGMVSATVPLAPSGFVIQGPGGGAFSMNLNSLPATLNVFTAAFPGGNPVLEAVAGNQSVSATVTSGTPTVGTIGASPVTIAGGASSGSTTFSAVGVGSSTITASATGYTSGTVTATVTSNSLAINNQLTIGQHLEANANVFLSSAAAGAAGVTVTLTVAPASIGLLHLAVNPTDPGANTITLNIAQGQSIGSYWIYALGSSGSATYTASAPSYGSAGDTTFLAPSSVLIVGPGGQPGSVAVSPTAGPQTLTVLTDQLTTDGNNTPQPGAIQALAGNVSLTVLLSNSNPGAGTLSAASVSIAPGTTSGTVTFNPAAAGNATISVTEPTGWTMPGLYGSFNLAQFVFGVQ